MRRRDFIKAVGAVGAVVAGVRAAAAESPIEEVARMYAEARAADNGTVRYVAVPSWLTSADMTPQVSREMFARMNIGDVLR